MVSIKYESGSIATALSTELNSLGDDSNAISGEIDNTSTLCTLEDVELKTGSVGYAFSSGAVVELFLIEAVDGTSYADGDATIDSAAKNLVGVFRLRASTSAQRHVIRRIEIPPAKYKYQIVQKTGQTWASSGNLLRHLPYKHKGV